MRYEKLIGTALLVAALPLMGAAQVARTLDPQPDPHKKLMTVETSCGECNYGMEGYGCDVAVRLPEGTFYVDGVGIEEYGHPHAAGGFCVAVRQAEVQGEVVDGRFKASYFKLLDAEHHEDQGKGKNKKEKHKRSRKHKA